MSKRNISRLIFGMTLVGFFLPFVSVTFFMKITFSGFQLIAGDRNYQTTCYAAAVFALLIAICGFGASFIEKKKSEISTVIISVIGLISLFSLGGQLSGGLAGSLVSMQFGYYMNILLFAGAGVVSVLSMKENSDGKLENIFTPKVNCMKCGAAISGKAEFCNICGNKVGDIITQKVTFDPEKGSSSPASIFNQSQGTSPINPVKVAPKPVLLGVAGQHSGLTYPFSSDKLILGRDPGRCHVVFAQDSPGISRLHCEVGFDTTNNNFILQDDGSSYGTFLASGVKLINGQPYVLKNRECFYLANKANMFEVSL